MSNKLIANGLLLVLGLSVLGGFIEVCEDYFTLLGLGFLVFVALAAHRLYKLADN